MKYRITIETPDDYDDHKGNYTQLMRDIKKFLRDWVMKTEIKQEDGLRCICEVVV